jgi:DNA-binding NarL/FixJ family response regulator
MRKNRADFSGRERDVLHRLALGMSDEQIAEQLRLSPNTVKSHYYSVRNKAMSCDHPLWSRDEMSQFAKEALQNEVG